MKPPGKIPTHHAPVFWTAEPPAPWGVLRAVHQLLPKQRRCKGLREGIYRSRDILLDAWTEFTAVSSTSAWMLLLLLNRFHPRRSLQFPAEQRVLVCLLPAHLYSSNHDQHPPQTGNVSCLHWAYTDTFSPQNHSLHQGSRLVACPFSRFQQMYSDIYLPL